MFESREEEQGKGKGVAKKKEKPLPRVSNCLLTDFTWGLEKEQGRSKGMAKKRALADRFHLGLAVSKFTSWWPLASDGQQPENFLKKWLQTDRHTHRHNNDVPHTPSGPMLCTGYNFACTFKLWFELKTLLEH